MGWHYILTFKCNILPEFIRFIEERYLEKFFDENDDIHYVSKPYRMYSSDDERGEEERARICAWEQEKEDEWAAVEKEYETLSKTYKDLIDIWRSLKIGVHFYEYDFTDGIFSCQISKKVNRHEGYLREDYEAFLKDIIVPISSEITNCTIESDDYGDCVWEYTDLQLRDITFRLQDKIKNVVHLYDVDGNIEETRVIYKRSIKAAHVIDLDRCYK
jgi:hypothetical protein